jgi:hypothetical protein
MLDKTLCLAHTSTSSGTNLLVAHLTACLDAGIYFACAMKGKEYESHGHLDNVESMVWSAGIQISSDVQRGRYDYSIRWILRDVDSARHILTSKPRNREFLARKHHVLQRQRYRASYGRADDGCNSRRFCGSGDLVGNTERARYRC